MTSEELKKLIETGENGVAEFKRGRGGVPGDFWPSYSAFANTDGGVIVLGVSEKNDIRVIEGVENPEKVRADLWNAANNPDKVSDNVLSNKRVYSLEVDGKVLVNALIHADYHGRRGIVIEKQFDTITFRNPGDLRLAKEIAIAGGTTDARNSKIFNIFALIDVGERSGMGLSNLYSTWAELGYDRPELEEFHEPDQTVLKVYLKTSTKSAKTSTKKTSTKNFGLPDEELVVLRLTSSRVVEAMRRNPKVTREELVEQLRVTVSGINWQIAKLQKDKVIRRVGGRKFGSWEVLI
ncbi:MAG: putative DNA binding domain-containing protein [Kiritimatiellae bacterium]|nr:putative DNA binding domain-containing protein [Kiritimatiellia bacterium]